MVFGLIWKKGLGVEEGKGMTLRAHAEALYEGLKSLLGNHDSVQVQAVLERELRHVVPTWNEMKPDCPGW